MSLLSKKTDKKTDKKADKEEGEVDASYAKTIERLEKKNITSVKTYESVLLEDDETSKKNASKATETEIMSEINLLLGTPKEWSSESEECALFRKNIKLSKHIDTSKTAVALPPVYTCDDPAPPNLKSGFVCTVNLVKKNMKKSVKCEAHMTAEEFADLFIEKMNVAHDFNSMYKDEWIFKATGTAEYFYGKHKMINFEFIRKCLKKGQKVELGLMDREAVLAELDPSDQMLKTITYDVEYTKEEARPSHNKLMFESNTWDSMKHISLWDLDRAFRVRIRGCDQLPISADCIKATGAEPNETVCYAVVELYHGGIQMAKSKYTRGIMYAAQIRWNQVVIFEDFIVSNLPREAKLMITVYGRMYKANDPVLTSTDGTGSIGAKDYPIGYVCVPLFDFKGILKSGGVRCKCWPDHAAKALSTCVQNDYDDAFVLSIELDKFALPVICPSGDVPVKMKDRYLEFEKKQRQQYPDLSPEKLNQELERILHQDPLYELSPEEKWLLWHNRDKLKNKTDALAKIMLSVPYGYPYAIDMAHQYLKEAAPTTPVDALELLDFNFADHKVRQYAFSRLDTLSDNQIEGFVLQLVQSLKFELYHDSALARFLLQRGLRSTHLIGHILFWHLKAEMHSPVIRERHGLILEEYLKTCGGHRRELLKQNGVQDQLLTIAMKVKKTKSADRLKVLREEVANNFKHPPKFKLPLSPRLEVTGIIPEKCKVMDSKKLPLWLAFKNADATGDPILVIFKAGDDLRQDLLTLQMLGIMDRLWKQNGLDLHMQPYGCVCTGDMTGMIEVVLNSDTIANITAARGGSNVVSKSLTAFSQDPLHVWLKKHNPNAKDWDQVVENFVLSCAGYCTATYVLGIGDRHNDNIMLTKRGDLFHIDFGHFLGHFKTFAGIKRETTPFVFTPMYAYVMGGADSAPYDRFRQLGAKAFNILRKQGNMIMNLFQLMLATGIPELEGVEDILWLRKCLVMNLNEDDANKWFYEKVDESLNNTRARINDAVHIMAHK